MVVDTWHEFEYGSHVPRGGKRQYNAKTTHAPSVLFFGWRRPTRLYHFLRDTGPVGRGRVSRWYGVAGEKGPG